MLLIEQVRHESHQFRPASRQKNYDDWDARSVYSVATTAHGAREDDMVSVVSTASRYTPFPQDADIESLVSNVDTLSFYNEPILSPYELTTIAEGGSRYICLKQRCPKRRSRNRHQKAWANPHNDRAISNSKLE